MNPDDAVTFAMSTDDAFTLQYNAQLGLALRNWVATCVQLGHASPASTLDYTMATEGPAMFVRDFVAWTSNREHLMEGCEERMRHFGASEANALVQKIGSDIAMGSPS